MQVDKNAAKRSTQRKREGIKFEGKIASALMYAWKGGLKTGVYYTRTKSKLDTNTKLASNQITTLIKQKPKDSQFECFGCTT
jgi:ribonucleotide reductase alpha subunit